MSFIPNFKEAVQWLSEWKAEADSGSERAKRVIRETAKEQRANLETVKQRGYNSAIRIPEYERSVKMIEKVAKSYAKERCEHDVLWSMECLSCAS